MSRGDRHDRVHFAADAGVVHAQIARVRGVIAASISVSSILSVSARMSTNTGTAPRSTNAFAVDTNVNDGMMTSSPGCEVEQQRGHLERGGARMRQQRAARAESSVRATIGTGV